MNLFNEDFTPMLLSKTEKPFNNKNYIFELKYDGIRALLFIKDNKLIIKSRSKEDITFRYPDLLNVKDNIKDNCIIDGEIIVLEQGEISFDKLKTRALLKDLNKIKYSSINLPVIFIAFDILYKNEDLTNIPLIKRKEILDEYSNTKNFIKAEYFHNIGKDLFKVAVRSNLEGIVAKEVHSVYKINKRSKDWIKIKNILDDDFTLLGYKEVSSNNVASLLFGNKNKIIGSTTIGKKNEEYLFIKKLPIIKNIDIENEGYIPVKPNIKITIEYLEKTKNGKLRHPKFKKIVK